MSASREQDYISQARQAAADIWNGIYKLKSMQEEWNALDYGNTLSDGEGANAGYTKTEVGAVVNTTADAIDTLIASGHNTNLCNLL